MDPVQFIDLVVSIAAGAFALVVLIWCIIEWGNLK